MTKWSYTYDTSVTPYNPYLYSYNVNDITPPVNSSLIKKIAVSISLSGTPIRALLSAYTYSFLNGNSATCRLIISEVETVNYTEMNRLYGSYDIYTRNQLTSWSVTIPLSADGYNYFNKWKVQSDAELSINIIWYT